MLKRKLNMWNDFPSLKQTASSPPENRQPHKKEEELVFPTLNFQVQIGNFIPPN